MDIAYVLMRRPPQPMIVVSKHWTFFITRSGSIVPVNLDGNVEIGDALEAAIEKAIVEVKR